jgi:hypothetical protein
MAQKLMYNFSMIRWVLDNMVSGMKAIDIFFYQNLFNIDCLKKIKSCKFSESYFSYELNMNITTTNFRIKGHFKH